MIKKEEKLEKDLGNTEQKVEGEIEDLENQGDEN